MKLVVLYLLLPAIFILGLRRGRGGGAEPRSTPGPTSVPTA